MTKTVERPILLLERDGYSIETVFAGRTMITAWILLHKDPYLGVEIAARGWHRSYTKAREEAFDAYLQHSDYVKATERKLR